MTDHYKDVPDAEVITRAKALVTTPGWILLLVFSKADGAGTVEPTRLERRVPGNRDVGAPPTPPRGT